MKTLNDRVPCKIITNLLTIQHSTLDSQNMKKILVTGGFGFIGSALVRQFNKEGHRITIFDKQKNSTRECCKDLKYAQFTDDPFCLDKSYTDIIHLGSPSSTDISAVEAQEALKMSTSFLRQAMHYKIPFYYASSAGVYGDTEPNFVGSKESDTDIYTNGNVDIGAVPMTPYAKGKLAFDKLFLESGATGMGLRFFNVWGWKGEEHKKQPSGPFRLNKSIKDKGVASIASFTVMRDWVNVDDVADTITRLVYNPRDGVADIVNFGSGLPFSFEDVANILIRRWNSTKGSAVILKKNFQLQPKEGFQYFTMANDEKLRSYNSVGLDNFKTCCI